MHHVTLLLLLVRGLPTLSSLLWSSSSSSSSSQSDALASLRQDEHPSCAPLRKQAYDAAAAAAATTAASSSSSSPSWPFLYHAPPPPPALLLGVPSSQSKQQQEQQRRDVPLFSGAAAGCRTVYLWGVQGSGSTFAWQVLKEVAAYVGNETNAHAAHHHRYHHFLHQAQQAHQQQSQPPPPPGESPQPSPAAEADSSGGAPINVMKGHYLNRMIKDETPSASGGGGGSSSSSDSSSGSSSGGSSGSSSDSTRCIAGTYRDFRDVICSHARRGGIQHVKACRDCDATELEKSEAIVRVLGKLFHKGGQAAETKVLERRGVLLLRYEHFVDCPRLLVDAFLHWLGFFQPAASTATTTTTRPLSSSSSAAATAAAAVSLPLSASGGGGAPSGEKMMMRRRRSRAEEAAFWAAHAAWREGVVAATSLSTNKARVAALGAHAKFGRYNPATGIHGGHISNGGRVGGFRSCMTPAVRRHVEDKIRPYLQHFNFSLDGD